MTWPCHDMKLIRKNCNPMMHWLHMIHYLILHSHIKYDIFPPREGNGHTVSRTCLRDEIKCSLKILYGFRGEIISRENSEVAHQNSTIMADEANMMCGLTLVGGLGLMGNVNKFKCTKTQPQIHQEISCSSCAKQQFAGEWWDWQGMSVKANTTKRYTTSVCLECSAE